MQEGDLHENGAGNVSTVVQTNLSRGMQDPILACKRLFSRSPTPHSSQIVKFMQRSSFLRQQNPNDSEQLCVMTSVWPPGSLMYTLYKDPEISKNASIELKKRVLLSMCNDASQRRLSCVDQRAYFGLDGWRPRFVADIDYLAKDKALPDAWDHMAIIAAVVSSIKDIFDYKGKDIKVFTTATIPTPCKDGKNDYKHGIHVVAHVMVHSRELYFAILESIQKKLKFEANCIYVNEGGKPRKLTFAEERFRKLSDYFDSAIVKKNCIHLRPILTDKKSIEKGADGQGVQERFAGRIIVPYMAYMNGALQKNFNILYDQDGSQRCMFLLLSAFCIWSDMDTDIYKASFQLITNPNRHSFETLSYDKVSRGIEAGLLPIMERWGILEDGKIFFRWKYVHVDGRVTVIQRRAPHKRQKCDGKDTYDTIPKSITAYLKSRDNKSGKPYCPYKQAYHGSNRQYVVISADKKNPFIEFRCHSEACRKKKPLRITNKQIKLFVQSKSVQDLVNPSKQVSQNSYKEDESKNSTNLAKEAMQSVSQRKNAPKGSFLSSVLKAAKKV